MAAPRPDAQAIVDACVTCSVRAEQYRLASSYLAYAAKESLVAAEKYRDELVRQYVAGLQNNDEYQDGMLGSDPLDFVEDAPCK